MKTINEAIKEFKHKSVLESKGVEIPSTSIELKKIANDANGNRTVYFVRKGKNKKIQTNGNMPDTHRLGIFKSPSQLKKLSDEDLKTIGSEIESYFKDIGESMKVIKKQLAPKNDIESDTNRSRFLNLVNGVFGTVKYDADKGQGFIPTRHLGDIPFNFASNEFGVYIEFSKGKKSLSRDDNALGKVIGKLMEIDKLGDWE